MSADVAILGLVHSAALSEKSTEAFLSDVHFLARGIKNVSSVSICALQSRCFEYSEDCLLVLL